MALVDTGASHSFIDLHTAEKYGIPFMKERLPEVTIGNSTSVSPVGLAKATIQINCHSFLTNLYVMKSLPFPIILGTDFLFNSKIVVDIANGCYYFSCKSQRKISFVNKEVLLALQGLNVSQEGDLNNLLCKYQDVLNGKIGCAKGVTCQLVVSGEPVARRAYRTSAFKKDIIKTHVSRMLELGVIKPSTSEWASPVNLVKQGDDYRFTIDYRHLNKRTKSDPYVIPNIESLLHRLGDACFISKIDLRKGYWQIAMHPDSTQYTAFVCDEGKYEFHGMPFGLKTAPSIFQRFMNGVLRDARGRFADAHLDDIIIYSRTWEEHMDHISFVLEQLRKANVTANIEKCEFGKTTLKYLGFIISPAGVSTDPEKVIAVREFPIPKCPKGVKSFVSLCGWYRHFIPNFSEIAEPLNCLMRKDISFSWGHLESNAFETVKNFICDAVKLAFPDFNKSFILRTDASNHGLGAVLAQASHDGHERPIAFASRSLSKCERNYHATERECLGIVWALKKFEHYLEGQEFILATDSRALVWLDKMRDINSKFMRWSLKIQDFQPCIVHCPGKLNVVVDALSCNTQGESEEEEVKEVMYPPINIPNLNFLSVLTSSIDIERIKSEQGKDTDVQILMSDIPQGFKISNGILFKITKTGKELPFIPKSLISEILSYFHDTPHSGHLGFRKTFHRISSRVFWFGMRESIFSYIKSCPNCQFCKSTYTKPHGNLQSNKVYGPWDMLALDLMGPLPKTKNGKTQLLVVVDHFTKWVELFALRDGKADKVCKVVESEIFCRWGSPKAILSDNATNFRGHIFDKLCKTWNVKHKFTTPYHPQCNITERINCNVKSVLTTFINKNHKKWDEYLPSTALALRTAISDTTGFSPSMMNLGREISLPFDRNLEEFSDDFKSRLKYQSELVNKLVDVYAKAHKNISQSQISQQKYYNLRHKDVVFSVGDLVLRRSHDLSNKSKGIAKTFCMKWSGPFIIYKVLSPVLYELKLVASEESAGTCNVKDLKLYIDRPDLNDCIPSEDAA
jgi:hypothetical protein